MTDQQGSEPTGWELMRGITDLKATVERLGGRVVSVEVYNADKQAAAERVQRAESRIKDLELAAAEQARDAEKARQEAEKLRRQQQFVIAMAVVSMVLTVIGGVILRSVPL